jgi:hypothetical protein
MLKIISRDNISRFNKTDLLNQMNLEIKDKRKTINKQHLAKIIKKQSEYDCNIRRNEYEFKKTTCKEHTTDDGIKYGNYSDVSRKFDGDIKPKRNIERKD